MSAVFSTEIHIYAKHFSPKWADIWYDRRIVKWHEEIEI